LLRVPGIGVTGAKRIVRARRNQRLDFDMLKRLGVVLKRARWFITCGGKTMQKIPETPEMMIWSILSPNRMGGFTDYGMEQLSLFEPVLTGEDFRECLTGEF
ncbi:MAG: biotin synthase, partial [Oscillospiraceae bacterium]|nr:biotin synthase [Oscillospiraceae bacterium]